MSDMYSQAGDPELTAMSPKGSPRAMKYAACERSGRPKEFFHIDSGKTHCTQCLIDFNIDRKTCQDSSQFCKNMMKRYVTLLDNAA